MERLHLQDIIQDMEDNFNLKKYLADSKLLKEEEEEFLPKKISNEEFTIVYQDDDMTEYEAYDELLSDREQKLIRNSAGVIIFTNKTPAWEVNDFVSGEIETAEEGNINLERVGLDKYWKY